MEAVVVLVAATDAEDVQQIGSLRRDVYEGRGSAVQRAGIGIDGFLRRGIHELHLRRRGEGVEIATVHALLFVLIHDDAVVADGVACPVGILGQPVCRVAHVGEHRAVVGDHLHGEAVETPVTAAREAIVHRDTARIILLLALEDREAVAAQVAGIEINVGSHFRDDLINFLLVVVFVEELSRASLRHGEGLGKPGVFVVSEGATEHGSAPAGAP